MKNSLIAVLISSFIIAIASCTVESGVVERRPADIVCVRPAAPGPEYVWVGGDWVWTGNTYRWHEGYWARTHQSRVYVNGHWDHVGNGWRWQKGHWK